MSPITRFIRALRKFNADNIALWEAFLQAQRPWEQEQHRGVGRTTSDEVKPSPAGQVQRPATVPRARDRRVHHGHGHRRPSLKV